MTDYFAALVFGGVVIVAFALDQFKRPSWEASQELTRMIEVLTPPDLRNGRVFYRAYAAYAMILLLIYLLICVYATVPVLKALGFAEEGLGDVDPARSPMVPLAVSLTMVGLAPRSALLQRVEEKIRFAAHHLSGIPARLLHGCRLLQTAPLGLPADGSGMLIPEKDWQRLRVWTRGAAGAVEDPEDFADDAAKILAYRAWVLRRRLNATGRAQRPGILRSQAEVKARIERLALGLDLLSGLHSEDGEPGPAEGSAEAWRDLAAEADQVCAEVCALLMLEMEHGVLTPDVPGDEAGGEEGRARAALSRFLARAADWADETALVGPLWVRATAVVVVMSFGWGVALGDRSVEFLSLKIGVVYAFSAFLVYSLAILAALTLHARRARTAREDGVPWPNMAHDPWARWMGPAAGLLLCAAAVSLICIVALNMISSLAVYGLETVSAAYWRGMWAALLAEGPRAMLGPILAVGVAASLDAWRAGGETWTRGRWRVAGITVAVMALWAPFSMLLAEQYALFAAYQGCVRSGGTTACDPAVVKPLLQLLSELRGEALIACLRTVTLGAATLYVCQETLAAGVDSEPAMRSADGGGWGRPRRSGAAEAGRVTSE